MAKDKDVALNGFWRDMFHLGIYKRNQGRITRQLTFAALAILVGVGAYRMSLFFADTAFGQYGIPWVLCAIGVWLSFRLVNMPRFADFLIAVEAEMSKVSWPTRHELVRGAVVVMITIFAMAGILYAFDLIWNWLLHLLGVGVGGIG